MGNGVAAAHEDIVRFSWGVTLGSKPPAGLLVFIWGGGSLVGPKDEWPSQQQTHMYHPNSPSWLSNFPPKYDRSQEVSIKSNCPYT